MNADRLKGKWLQAKGRAKQRWGKLTDDDLDRIEGSVEELAGIIQERHGISRDEAKRQVDEFYKTL